MADERPELDIPDEAIAARAYAIYCARQGTPDDGGAADDWAQAEAELRAARGHGGHDNDAIVR